MRLWLDYSVIGRICCSLSTCYRLTSATDTKDARKKVCALGGVKRIISSYFLFVLCGVCVCMPVCMCLCAWRPEVNAMSSLSLSYYIVIIIIIITTTYYLR